MSTATAAYEPKPLEQIDVEAIKTAIRSIPDFPQKGILFRDITTVLNQGDLFQQVVDYFYHKVKDLNVDYIVGIESRGFIMGAPLAYRLGAGFVPIRKVGKLPGDTTSHEYALEYGTDVVEIHTDAVPKGARVVLIDDLLATGGTAAAAINLLEKIGAEVVSTQFMIELDFLNGREKLDNAKQIDVMIHY